MRRFFVLGFAGLLAFMASPVSAGLAAPTDPPEIRYVLTQKRDLKFEARWDVDVGAYRTDRMRFRTEYMGDSAAVSGRKLVNVVRVGYRGHPWAPRGKGRHPFRKLILRQLHAQGRALLIIRAISPQGEDLRRLHAYFPANYVCRKHASTCQPESP
jgi:hypothetical protein